MAAEVGGREGKGGMVHGVRSLGSAALDLVYVATGAVDIFWEGGCDRLSLALCLESAHADDQVFSRLAQLLGMGASVLLSLRVEAVAPSRAAARTAAWHSKHRLTSLLSLARRTCARA